LACCYRRDEFQPNVPPDIDITFASNPGATTAQVTRNLTNNTAPVSNWTLSTNLSFGNVNIPQQDGIRVEILDASGKVIADVEASQPWPNPAELLANGQPIFHISDGTTFINTVNVTTLLNITASGGQITFTYGTYAPITTPVFDSASNWQQPKTLLVYAFSSANTAGSSYNVNFNTLHFVETP
jgi:hypothetical protein